MWRVFRLLEELTGESTPQNMMIETFHPLEPYLWMNLVITIGNVIVNKIFTEWNFLLATKSTWAIPNSFHCMRNSCSTHFGQVLGTCENFTPLSLFRCAISIEWLNWKSSFQISCPFKRYAGFTFLIRIISPLTVWLWAFFRFDFIYSYTITHREPSILM